MLGLLGLIIGGAMFLLLLATVNKVFPAGKENIDKNHELINSRYWEYFLLRPNSILVWRMLAGLPALYFYFTGCKFIGITVFTFSALADTLDGMIARRCRLITKAGEFLDPLCDKIMTLGACITLHMLGLPIGIVFLIILISLEIGVNQLVVRYFAIVNDGSIAAKKAGKQKTLFMFLFIIFLAVMKEFAIPGGYWLVMIFQTVCIFLSLRSSYSKIPIEKIEKKNGFRIPQIIKKIIAI